MPCPPWKISWRSKVPPRVAFFSWIAALGKILSTNNLQKRDIIVLDCRYMCKRKGEFVDHLIYCPIDYEACPWCFFYLEFNGLFHRGSWMY